MSDKTLRLRKQVPDGPAVSWFLPEQFPQGRLAPAGILLSGCHGKGPAATDKYRQLPCPGQSGIDEVAVEHLEMLGQHRQNDGPELAALGFVDRDGIGQIELGDGVTGVRHDPAVRVEGNR